MEASSELAAGRLDGALAAVKDLIRKNPADSSHRTLLFQLYCVLGNWDAAETQIKVVSDLDPGTVLFTQVYTRALQCEKERREVLAGNKTPVIIGEPDAWLGNLQEAFRLGALGDWPSAVAQQQQAFEMAPGSTGTINGTAFQWICDADSRFGPVLEAFIDGNYRWIPFHRISSIFIDQPRHLIDTIWLPAKLTWTNQGMTKGFIPAIYPGSDTHEDPLIKLGRKTDWDQKGEDYFCGLGQKLFATDTGDYPAVEIREILLSHADAGVAVQSAENG